MFNNIKSLLFEGQFLFLEMLKQVPRVSWGVDVEVKKLLMLH